MSFSYDSIIAVAAFILSLAVGVRSMRKTDAEKSYLDAQTFAEYQESLKRSHENYQTMQKEVSSLRGELEQVKLKADRLESHNRALINQLIENSLVPITIEEALKRRG